MDEIGVNNTVLYQLVNEHQNCEVLVVEYDNNGEISGVDENKAALAVDIPLDKIPGVYP